MQSKVPHIYSKIAKLALWVLVPVVFISGTKTDNHLSSGVSLDKGYTMQMTGNLNESFSGMINFETSFITTSKGVSFSILKLKLDNKESIVPHSMEFLISKENTAEVLPAGRYKVLKSQEGLLNYFDGVFGFANINVLGESPLFAKGGEIQIDYLDKITINGTFNITMSNTMGKSVQMKGKFGGTR